MWKKNITPTWNQWFACLALYCSPGWNMTIYQCYAVKQYTPQSGETIERRWKKRGNGMGTLMELKTRKHEYNIPGVWALMLTKTAIKKGQSRGTSNTGHSRHRTKKKTKNKTKIKTRTQKAKKMRKTDPIKIPGVNTCAGEEQAVLASYQSPRHVLDKGKFLCINIKHFINLYKT